MHRQDSDCEELADVGADLEAMFGFELGVDSEDGFNLKEVAEALNGGANRRELEDIIEAGLAERLEYRLCSPAATSVPSAQRHQGSQMRRPSSCRKFNGQPVRRRIRRYNRKQSKAAALEEAVRQEADEVVRHDTCPKDWDTNDRGENANSPR